MLNRSSKMKKTIIKSLVLVMVMANAAVAGEVITGYDNTTLPILNEELRGINSKASNLDDTVIALNTTVYQLVPPGSILGWGAAAAPTGWLLCDGSAVSRTTYAALFSAIGTTFGAGDGSTTFTLPNFKGKVLVGLNGADSDFDAINETGGEKTHTLTTDEIPPLDVAISSSWTVATGANTNITRVTDTAEGGFTVKTSGGSGAHNNLQPYITINYIIKT
jgi:microcystin-dependent protein